MASSPLVALQETRLLTERPDGEGWFFHRSRAAEYNLTIYSTAKPLLVATLDEPNAALLGLDRVTLIEGRKPYQEAALLIHRGRKDIPALTWRSRHREANGFVVGLFHDEKAKVGLSKIQVLKLADHEVIEELGRMRTLSLG